METLTGNRVPRRGRPDPVDRSARPTRRRRPAARKPAPDAGVPQVPAEEGQVQRLVRLAQAGDNEALNTLFSIYYKSLLDRADRQLGKRLRAKEDPDDLAQTTLREATRDFARYEYRGEDSLEHWLMQILQNKVRDKAEFYAAGKRDSARERALDVPARDGEAARTIDPASRDLSVTRMVQRNEQFEVLAECMDELSEDHRQAIELVYFQGLPLREAGRRMGGRTEDAVRMLARRAANRLGRLAGKRLNVD